MKNIITMVNYLVPLLFIFCCNYVRCESDNCNFDTCGDCISYEAERCVWCSQEVFDGRRCRPLNDTDTNSWCKDEFLVDPQPTLSMLQNQEFGQMKDGFQVQFKPQLIKMKARPGIEISFDMSFKPAKDFPVDVFFLMDVSNTMRSKMADLKNQATEIFMDLSAYTNNVRLGVGSFVEDRNKHKSHAFKNVVPLTYNMVLFKAMVDKILFGSNSNNPEVRLDALMQAMTSSDAVGWRTAARRIIVLCTDSTYRSAADGKIVGAIKPHEMNLENKNSEVLTSVSQINRVATDGNFRIIFAITENTQTLTPEKEYRELANQIAGARYVTLGGGTSVVKIIKEAYEELANSVQLKYQAPSFVEVNIDQDCDSEHKKNCEISHEQTVHITGTLKATSCPPADVRNLTHKVTVSPLGQADKLIIELDVDCECDCEKLKGVTTA